MEGFKSSVSTGSKIKVTQFKSFKWNGSVQCLYGGSLLRINELAMGFPTVQNMEKTNSCISVQSIIILCMNINNVIRRIEQIFVKLVKPPPTRKGHAQMFILCL